jgi:hypothetical protein
MNWYDEGVYAGQEFHGIREPLDPYVYFGLHVYDGEGGAVEVRKPTRAEQHAIDQFLAGYDDECRAVDNRHAWASAPI